MTGNDWEARQQDHGTTRQRDNETTRHQKNTGVLRYSQAFLGIPRRAWQCVAAWRESGADTTLGEFRGDGLYYGVLPIAEIIR